MSTFTPQEEPLSPGEMWFGDEWNTGEPIFPEEFDDGVASVSSDLVWFQPLGDDSSTPGGAALTMLDGDIGEPDVALAVTASNPDDGSVGQRNSITDASVPTNFQRRVEPANLNTSSTGSVMPSNGPMPGHFECSPVTCGWMLPRLEASSSSLSSSTDESTLITPDASPSDALEAVA